MDNCDKIRDRLLDLIDGELAGGERRRIETHLAQCSSCSQEARALRETLACVQSLPEPAVPDGLLEGFAAAVQRRIAHESSPRLPFWQRVVGRLNGFHSLRPIPALSAAAVLGLLLAIGLVRTPRLPQTPPTAEVVVLGESLSIAQNLDVLEQFDLLEELDVLEQLPFLRAPENGQSPKLS
jgi:anti-sigma factor RsiW